jgi:uncharacterized protein (TIGR03086 family)
MTSVDLEPAASRMADLIEGVPDDLLGRPTPCEEYTLGDLIDHVAGAAVAFAGAARKDMSEVTARPASADASRLSDDWRARIRRDLSGLASDWRDPAAWTGMTRVGGIELPGEMAGLIGLDELVVHGWDVARASGQPFDCDPELLEVVHGLLVAWSSPGQDALRNEIFEPVVQVGEDAPLLDRVIGLSGRDPAWAPPA